MKTIRNTTGSTITLSALGLQIPAGITYTIEVEEYLVWASDVALAEVSPFITSGDLVVNDGLYDLAPAYGIYYLKYPDLATNVRFLSDPERLNGFVAKTVQEAIEEAATGTVTTLPAAITVGAVTVIAYSESLADNTSYTFRANIVARRTDVAGDTGDFDILVRVKREGGGPATIVGHTFQERAMRTDSGMVVDWTVSGNDIRLTVTGVVAKTIKWQPEINRNDVS